MNCLSIPFTYSRGALLGLAVVLPGIFPRLRKFVFVLPLLIPVGFLAYDLLPEKLTNKAATIGTYEEDLSAMSRIRSWRVAINIALERPLTGAGFDFEDYPDPSRWHSYVPPEYVGMSNKIWVAHSIYFSVLGYHGFVALGIFVAMLIYSVIDLKRLERRVADHQEVGWIAPYARALRIGLIGYMVAGAFLNSAYFDLTYIFIALLAILQREVRSAESRAGQAAKDAAAPAAVAPAIGPSLGGGEASGAR
jgi:probable O-glycosylation ligase (exosortase A-associated)